VQIDDGMAFELKSVSPIMEDAEFPGFRVSLDTTLESMRTTIRIDFSTGDIITPRELLYTFKLLFEDRVISILAYNLETMLAEKLETMFTRGTANSRMRDFYDIFALELSQSHNIDKALLKRAYVNTSKKRGSYAIIADMELILNEIESSPDMMASWTSYQRKYEYASDISWDAVMQTVRALCGNIM
jgi:predicted nucleotidyltransferase component of viral defense system